MKVVLLTTCSIYFDVCDVTSKHFQEMTRDKYISYPKCLGVASGIGHSLCTVKVQCQNNTMSLCNYIEVRDFENGICPILTRSHSQLCD